MKQLIKKIKKLQNALTSHCYQVTLLQVLGMIEEDEKKSFNPLELGFIYTEITSKLLNKEPNIDVLEFELIKTNQEYRLRFFKKDSKIWIFNKFNHEIKYTLLVNLIKIPNHRFGKELLKNLGVIK